MSQPLSKSSVFVDQGFRFPLKCTKVRVFKQKRISLDGAEDCNTRHILYRGVPLKLKIPYLLFVMMT